MSAIVRLSLVLASLAVAAGCESGPDAGRDIETALVQPPGNVVELSVRAERLAFEPGQAALTGDRLAAFRRRMSPSDLGRDHLVLVAPEVAGDAVSEARAEWTLAWLQGAGVSALRSATPLPAPSGAIGGGVVLEIQQARVTVPACEAYPRSLAARIDEAASARPLGCANAANLGRMVADPVDLVRGRALDPADAVPTVRAIDSYRSAGTKTEGSNPIAEAFAKAFGGKDK